MIRLVKNQCWGENGGGTLSHTADGLVNRYNLFGGQFGGTCQDAKCSHPFASATPLKDLSSELLIQLHNDIRLYTAEHSVKVKDL